MQPGGDRDPLALKRKRDASVTAAAKRFAQANGLSTETRARRKREWLQLREENARLRAERDDFLRKIAELEKSARVPPQDQKIASENEMLRAEIREHAKFIQGFARLAEAVPSERSAQDIYREGAQAAQSILTSLISKSQSNNKSWHTLKVPSFVLALGPIEKLTMSYNLEQEDENDMDARLEVRCDVKLRDCRAEVLADVFWRMFSDHDVQSRLYKSPDLVLRDLGGSMPDKHTKLCHFVRHFHADSDGAGPRSRRSSSTSSSGGAKNAKRNAKDRHTVFVVNRERRLMAKSTLAPPRAGRRRSPSGFVDEHGQVSTIAVAATTTTLFERANLSHDLHMSADAERIRPLVAKGAIVWEEDHGARAAIVYSVPDAYQAFEDLVPSQCIRTNGVPTLAFARLFADMAQAFVQTLQEAMGDLKSGKIDLVDLSPELAL